MLPAPVRALTALILVLAAGLTVPATSRAGSYLPGPQDSYKVFVIGDSLAGGLWAGLARQMHDDPALSVTGRFKAESGLARPEIYDWPRALAGILERNQFDIAIVMIGANDGRDIRQRANRLSYGSPEWIAAYKDNIKALLDVLKRARVAVYWVGLPPMQSPQIDGVAATVTRLQHDVMNKTGIRFISIRANFANADGSYTDSGFDLNGNFVRLRSRNGVNLLRSGNDKLASLVLSVLRADIAAAQHIGAASETSQDQGLEPAPRQRAAYDGPVFGKDLANGEVVQIDPRELPSPDAVAVARIPLPAPVDKPVEKHRPAVDKALPDPAPSLAGLKLAGPPGSAAEKLFTTGEAPQPEPGRIDDFRIAQPAQ